jgi:hypothetical protein
MTKLIRSMLAVVAVLAATPAMAEMMSYKADLKGTSEVPPTTSQGAGNLMATVDTVSKKLTWKGTVSGLSGNATAAHFHGPAEPGKNARVGSCSRRHQRPVRRVSDIDRRSGQGADGWPSLF